MKIVGLQKTSLIDYPGEIVTTLFTQGCNLKCIYCHNPELISLTRDESLYFDVGEVLDFLQDRKRYIDGVCITGGEPTLQEDLAEFINELKSAGFKVKLDTNGIKVKVLKRLINDKLIDYIAMDVKTSGEKLDILGRTLTQNSYSENIKESIDLIINSSLEYEFRTTVVPGIHQKEEVMKIAKLIKGAEKYYIQNFKSNSSLSPDLRDVTGFSPEKLKEFKEAVSFYVQKVEVRN